MTPRYRMSDLGVLLWFSDELRRWIPFECRHYQHYCSDECRDLHIKGNVAEQRCVVPGDTFELED